MSKRNCITISEYTQVAVGQPQSKKQVIGMVSQKTEESSLPVDEIEIIDYAQTKGTQDRSEMERNREIKLAEIRVHENGKELEGLIRNIIEMEATMMLRTDELVNLTHKLCKELVVVADRKKELDQREVALKEQLSQPRNRQADLELREAELKQLGSFIFGCKSDELNTSANMIRDFQVKWDIPSPSEAGVIRRINVMKDYIKTAWALVDDIRHA